MKHNQERINLSEITEQERHELIDRILEKAKIAREFSDYDESIDDYQYNNEEMINYA